MSSCIRFVCMSVIALSSILVFLPLHYTFSSVARKMESCLNDENRKQQKNTSPENRVWASGMATISMLIGSYNNHPKWQTIGWIKYTCWLNYCCNVVTPTLQLQTTLVASHIHNVREITFVLHNCSNCCVCIGSYFVYSLFCSVISLRWFQAIRISFWKWAKEMCVRKLCRIQYAMWYQHQRNWLSWHSSKCRRLSNWRSGINWWSILYSLRYRSIVWVSLCLCCMYDST